MNNFRASDLSLSESLAKSTADKHCSDGVIERSDGTLEIDGFTFEVDWDAIDPPEGHPDAQEMPHEEVVSEICKLLKLPHGAL